MVADNFKFGADKNIIVALEHNVLVANKKDLAKVLNMISISIAWSKLTLSQPTRSSLAPNTLLSTPAKKIRQSHSDIVNSPY